MIFNIIGRLAAWHERRNAAKVEELRRSFKTLTNDIEEFQRIVDSYGGIHLDRSNDMLARRQHRLIERGREEFKASILRMRLDRDRVAAELRTYGINMEAL